MTALALLVTQNVFAADPDLSGYTAIKTMDFSKATYASDVFITLSTTQCGTAFETGNKLYQKIYEVATPEELQGYLALQAAYDGSKKSKGWWLRSTKGGLYSFNGPRSGAVINLKKDYVVAFNCTQDAEKVMSLINDKGEPDGSFTYEKSEDTKTYYATMTADGQVNFCGNKSAGYISSIVVYAPGTVVVQPTAAYTAVNGTSRTVTFTGANLAYNTDGSDTYTNFKDGEGNNVNKAEVTVSETTTYYVVSTNGEQKSDVLQFTIEAGTELSLATPVASITKMGEGFARTYSVVCNNKDVLLTPTAKLTYDFTPSGEGEAESGVECNGTIEATAAGTYVVTASAEGYTSTSVTIDNTKEYELTKAIDFTTLKAEDLSANWKKKAEGVSLPGSSSQWPAKYGDVVADKYFYDFSAESASATDVLAGLNVEINKDGKAPVLFTGFGMMYPIYQMNAEGEDNTENKVAITDGKLSIADGTADQVGVYTYINNYGKNGTKTTIVAGDKEFALYRFSDILTKVEVYSPKKEVIDTPVLPEGDVTAKYLVNPGFEDCEAATGKVGTAGSAQGTDYEAVGWKLASSAAWSNSAAFAYGSDASLNDAAVPATDNAGNTGKALGFTVGWGGTNSYQSAAEVVLPAGYYTLKAHAYNGGTATQFASKLGFATADKAYTSTKNSFALNEWIEDVVEFTLESETAGHFTIGGAAVGGGSGANGKVFFDNITLERQDFLTAASNNLAKEIATAKEIASAGLAPTADLLAAIATAEEATTKTDYKEILAAIEPLKAAVAAYNDVNVHFVAFADAKAKYATLNTQYASEEKIAAVNAIAEKTPASADEADALLADYIKAVRVLAESNALAEGVEGATNYTESIKNANAEALDGWTTSLGEINKGKIEIKNGEPFTDAEANSTHTYFDGGSWGDKAWDVTFSQDVTLPKGKYLLTATSRASVDLASFTLFAGEARADMQHVGNAGELFDRGWNDCSVEFEVAEDDATVNLGVQGVADKQYQWMSFTRFRLVKVGEVAPSILEINNLADLRKIEVEDEWAEVPVKVNLHDAKITALHKSSDYGMDMIDFAILEDATGAIAISALLNEATATGLLEDNFTVGAVLNGSLYALYSWPNSLSVLEDMTQKSVYTVTPSTLEVPEAKLGDILKYENDLRVFELKDVTIKNVGNEEYPEYNLYQDGRAVMLSDALQLFPIGQAIPEKLESITGILYGLAEELGQEVTDYMFVPTSYKSTPVVENIAGLSKIEGGEMEDPSVKLMLKNAKITYVQNMDEGIDPRATVAFAILEDETGAVEISNIITKANANSWFDGELKEGVELNGYINVNYSAWSTALVANDETSKSVLTITPTTITPTEAKIADLQKAENHLRLFELKDVDFAVEDGAPVIKQDDASIILADQFFVLPEDMPETAKFESVVGVVFLDFESYVFCPISYKLATVSGISALEIAAKNAAVYNLNGAKVLGAGESVKGLAKGIYVVGGKKIVVK